jgi:hypothetical protein
MPLINRAAFALSIFARPFRLGFVLHRGQSRLPLAGKVDQAGGVAVRLQDADNYYVARANALEDNVRFDRVVAGRARAA